MNSSRTPVNVAPATSANTALTVGTILVLPQQRYEQIAQARKLSKLSWPAWLNQAISRLTKEPKEEIESLLTSVPSAVTKDKRLSLRLFPEDMERVRAIASEYGVTQRNVLLMAASLRMMQVELADSNGS